MLQSITPTQAEAAKQHKSFHSTIAQRAAALPKKQDNSFSIPNTPYGVPKIPPDKVVEVIRYVAPAYSYVWCYDLVRLAETYAPAQAAPSRILVSEIQRAVASFYGVTVRDIVSERRTRTIIRPRQVAYWLSRELTTHSLPEIGRRFGDRDHTAVLWGCRKISRLRKEDSALAQELCALAISLGGSVA